MKTHGFVERDTHSAQDFVKGVQPVLERQLSISVHPIEELKLSELARKLDQNGIDAFYYDTQGHIRGLASRMNYSQRVSKEPSFTFRYALYDRKTKSWDTNREFQRKLLAANAPQEFILFPKLHVESFCTRRGEGVIGWSFAAETKDIVNYIQTYIGDTSRVRIFTPSIGERRQVVSVPIEVFAKEHRVIEVAAVPPTRSM